MARERGRPPYADVLTPAEWRVVEAVRHGMTNPTIARRQGVSLDAVKYHVANALQKLELSSRADLRRWEGVRRDSPLSRKELPMKPDVRLGAIGQIARTVKDIEAARRWYGEVLGLPHLYSFGNLAFLRAWRRHCCLYLSEGDDMARPGRSPLFPRRGRRSGPRRARPAGCRIPERPHLNTTGTKTGREEWMRRSSGTSEGPPAGDHGPGKRLTAWRSPWTLAPGRANLLPAFREEDVLTRRTAPG